MNLATHRVSQAVFRAICSGRGGPEAINLLRSAQRSKTVMSVGAVVHLAQSTRHPHRTLVTDSYQMLRDIEADSPDAVGTTLDYPTVGAWAMRTAAALHRNEVRSAEPERLAAVAAAAAVRARVPARLSLLPRSKSRVSLPSLGVAVLPEGHGPVEFVMGPDGPHLVTGRQRVHLSGTGTGGWFGLPVVRATHRDRETVLRFDNLDPQDGPSSSAIPDGATAARWQARVAPGWRLLIDRHREVADEFIQAITVLAPLPDPAAGTVSATARHAFGAIAMSTPTSPRSVAVTLAHELQHAKLSAVMDLLPLVEAGPTGRFYAPWRSDPRPFIGVLHGVYAHLAIADFWRRELAGPHGAAGLLAAEVEYVRWRDAVSGTATRLLGTDRLTDLGRRLVTIVLDTVGGWHEEVSARARTEANRASRRHRAQWEKMHGRVP